MTAEHETRARREPVGGPRKARHGFPPWQLGLAVVVGAVTWVATHDPWAVTKVTGLSLAAFRPPN
jgi:hypothetical protein